MTKSNWESQQYSTQGIQEIEQLWKRLENNALAESSLYLEFLMIRIFLGLGNYINIEYHMKLDSNFEPISVASANKPDAFIDYPDFGIIIETTERPIAGKVDHFSHITSKKK